jgi:hypothetical protein
MKLPTVLVFTITYAGKDYCLDKFLENAKKLTYPNKRHIFIDNNPDLTYFDKLRSLGLEVYHTERGANSREALARSQNLARKIAVEQGFDYMFSLESDILPPINVIEQLMVHGKDVITGLYYIGDKKKNIRVPCVTVAKWNETLGAYGTRLLTYEEFGQYRNKGVKRVQAGGFGCCLISKQIFTKYGFYYDPRFKGHSDIYFFNDLFRNQIPVFIDTDVICEHDNSDWLEVVDR